MNRFQQLIARLAEGVEPNECLEWWGGKNGVGYASIRTKAGHFLGHRVALEWKIKRQLEPDEYACHECDNPGCVNPYHLYAGTPLSNSQDKHNRRRAKFNPCRGERHPLSKLTVEQIIEIRNSTEQARTICKKYGVGSTLIYNIRSGKTWSHV